MRMNFKSLALLMFFVLFASFPWAFQPYQEHEHQQPLPDRHRDRWYWQMPYRIIDEAGIQPGMTVADVGAGDGYFTFRLAERVGPDGRVYANDIDNRALQVVRDKCREEDIRNVAVIFGKEDDPLLPEKSMDIVLKELDIDLSVFFVEGQVWHELAPREDEIVIHKPSYGAFYDTPLETILKNLGKDTVIICGTVTNICCGMTARQAYERSFKVVFGSDVTSSDNPELQEPELKVLRKNFARVLSTDEIIDELK